MTELLALGFLGAVEAGEGLAVSFHGLSGAALQPEGVAEVDIIFPEWLLGLLDDGLIVLCGTLVLALMQRAPSYTALTDSEGIANDNLFKYPSRFIAECGEENIISLNPPDKELTEKAKHFAAIDEERLSKLSDLYAVGTRVLHEVFREGTVTAVDVKGGFYTIQFDNLPTQRNLRIAAKLEKIEY